LILIYQLRPSVITADQLPTDMPKGYTSGTPREAPKKRRDTPLEAALRKLRMPMQRPMRKMIGVDELHKEALAEAEAKAWGHLHGIPPRKKKKKKDVPPRFKLIIPPVH